MNGEAGTVTRNDMVRNAGGILTGVDCMRQCNRRNCKGLRRRRQIPWGTFDNYLEALYKIGKSNDLPQIPTNISNSFNNFLLYCFNRNYKERPSIKDLLTHEFLF